MRNVVSNALKFTPSEGTVTVDAQCVMSDTLNEGGVHGNRRTSAKNGVVRVTVADTGAGMTQVTT